MDTMHRTAILSPCGAFRYRLGRRWADGAPLLFVMLNPSVADADIDDPTIRRCIGFARAGGFPAITVVNLFAFRATKPAELARLGWQVGPHCDSHIEEAALEAAAVCLAYGALHARAEARVQHVLPLIRSAGHEPQCLRITRSGFPSHPLYLPGDCRLQPYSSVSIQEAVHS